VIRHDDVTPNRPPVAIASGLPFLDQNRGGLFASKDRLPEFGAGREEIDRLLDPNPLKTPQMLVHVSL